ncbi:cbb3-type cytochrome c oxidase subunit I [Geoalkalibacter halelectricus]|uniref:Cbb3-type cytochrome c oxidase subunit I n=1 Tax=Geoalkalibacter halelectricus TaxID=2847045 RepID=A0ABY5ZTM7_9BACT|nr:cbb3-type cytochrome c oxidase subunit I [Geoalkalibacter halelectricus]MDO3376742.1 cbb3-type cytochrome c oxidase subunit I [Geoalkalibacter halelectricus]UWZ81307.1 cbb3-type cytochrome c oxidase subunit I [Geoalkalibacter halelectricus]
MKPDALIEERFTRTWLSRPGFWGWIAEVNNRPLGVRYMVTSLVFFALAVVMALTMRTQLALPDNNLLSPDTYNAVFTMHGSTMLYLFAVPFVEGLGLYLIPLLIGARDVAFPRLTSFGYWMYLFGGLIIFSSFLFGEVPDAGWTAYTPLSGPKYSGIGIDFWLLGLGLLEIAGITAAIEIVTTILKFRAPGMALQHMPLIAWTYLVIGFMILFSFPVLLLATLLLELDRAFGFQFFNPSMGGSSLLWQHLFWWFGHPEVYIIFLPATGVISTIIPVFVGRRIVAYPLILAALLITGFVSFGLWTHHMFTSGIPELPMLFFTAASFMVALAAGIQIFAWIATLWGGRPRLGVPLLYILAFFYIFVQGGLTGVMVATMPFDWQTHDTTFVVAHFHDVLIGGAVLPFIAAFHYWLPKMTGRLGGEFWDRIGLGFIFVGYNITFVPLYIAGLFGMRRRIYTYPEEMGIGTLNLISTFGSYLLALGFAIALASLLWHARRGRPADPDPWKGGTLEWSMPSPAPPYGFRRPLVVGDLYPLWNPVPSESHSGDSAPRDAYTEELEQASAAMDCRPAGWRGNLVTDGLNGRPQAVQSLPGPTLLPFWLAVVMTLATVFFLAQQYMASAAMGFVSLVFIGWWLTREPVFDREEAAVLEAQLQVPLWSHGRHTTGWWAAAGTVAVLFTVFGALTYSYFYLRLYSDHWPQGGLPLPELGSSLLVFALLAAGGVSQFMSSLGWRRRSRTWVVFGMAVTLVLGVGFVIVQMMVLHAAPFGPTANAYASIFFVLNGFVLLTVLTGLALLGGALVRVIAKQESFTAPRLILWLQISEMLWFFAVFAGLACFLVAYLVPHLL